MVQEHTLPTRISIDHSFQALSTVNGTEGGPTRSHLIATSSITPSSHYLSSQRETRLARNSHANLLLARIFRTGSHKFTALFPAT